MAVEGRLGRSSDRFTGWVGSPWIRAAGAGLAGGLALPPLGCPPLLWLAVAVLWSTAAGPAPARCGALWGGLAVLVSHRWLLGLHPLDWIGVPLPLSLPLCGLLLLICAGLGAGLVALWSALAARLDGRRFSSAVLLACSWGLVEVLLAKGPLFWLGLGASALPQDPPLAALAALGGSGLVAAVQLLAGWGLWRVAVAQQRRRALAVWVLVVLVLHAGGAWWLAGRPPAPGRGERVLVLQPGIPTREKFSWASRRRLDRLLAQALEHGRQQRADAVVLPEGALGLDPVLETPVPVELLSGGFRWQPGARDPEQRSALLRFPVGSTRPQNAVDKHRLVPLGEWVPLAGLVRWSGLSAVGGIEPGEASRLLQRPAGPVGVAICYELSDGAALAAATRQGATWLLASANLDPYPLMLQRQFEALARLRALETGRWLVSSANTGPSLLVNPLGEVVARLDPGGAAEGLFPLGLPLKSTGYVRWGEVPLLLALLLAGLGRWWAGGLSRRTEGPVPRG